MATIVEDYVSFETAKLLKDKGFNEETEYIFSNNGELLKLSHLGIKDLTNTDCNDYHTWQFPIEGVASIISAPTLQMAMKWLREVHNLVIQIEFIDFLEHGEVWLYLIIERKTIKRLTDRDEDFTEHSYEEACETAIKYCLENLI